MDEGRYKDLMRFRAIVADRTQTRRTRMGADRSIGKILAQLKDPTLRRLRERLIRAAKAGDLQAEWRIANAIRAHVKQQRMEVPV